MRRTIVFLGCISLASCSAKGASYDVLVRATDDLGKPMSRVALSVSGAELGSTDEVGQRLLNFPGDEGQQLEVSVACPKGYDGPREPSKLTLQRIPSAEGSGTSPIELNVTCASKEHIELVAVRTGQPGLPILLHGQPIAQTSSTGTAHVMVRDAVGSSFQLTLDTGSNPELHPENPTRTFSVTQHDAFALWNQTFERARKAPALKKRGKPKRATPASRHAH